MCDTHQQRSSERRTYAAPARVDLMRTFLDV
jgi:hypothetical protein